MISRTSALSLAALLALMLHQGCNNALNPLCGSSRPAPLIGSLSPSTLTFAQVQHGVVVTVNGSQFVPSSEVIINGKTLATTVTSAQQLTVTINSSVISEPGTMKVSVHTPGGNSGDVGCSSGGDSSVLNLTITQ